MSQAPSAAPTVAPVAYGRWAIAITLAVITGIWTASSGLDPKVVCFCVITISALAIWALELLPDGIVAIAIPALYIITKVGLPKQILSPWTSSIGWLILGGLLIGAFMTQTGLAKRLALHCIMLMGGSFNRLLWGILLAGVVMAPFIPSVLGRSAVIAVICIGMCEALNLEKGSREGSAILLAGFVAVSGPKMAFLTGGADLAMGMKLASQAMKTSIPWIQYAIHNTLPAMMYSGFSLACIILVLRPRVAIDIKKVVAEQAQRLGPMTSSERKAMLLLAVLLMFLLTDKLHGVDVGWIMLLLPCIAFLPGFQILAPRTLGSINLASVFFVVGCMTIGSAAMACGVDKMLSKALLPMLSGSELYTVMATYATGVVLNLLLTPMAAYASLTTTVVGIGQQINVDPLLMVYAFSYGLDQYVFPYEYAILLYFYATGYSKIGHIIKIFGIRMIITGFFIAGVAYPFWKFVL